MSQLSTTTWNYEIDEPYYWAAQYQDIVGTALFLFEDQIIFCCHPKKKAQTDEITSLGNSELPIAWVGQITYEKKGFFYQPSTVILFDKKTHTAELFGKNLFLKKRDFQTENLLLTGRSETKKSFCEKVSQIHQQIKKGNVYQVNLSQNFFFDGTYDPLSLFRKVYLSHPTPYAVFIHTDQAKLLSFSPELFFKTEGSLIETRPIKGTISRGKTAKEDHQNKKYLRESIKEQAELLMITDLLRNDLNRICHAGSVQVKELFSIAEYPSLFQMYSVIQARHQNRGFSSLFPAGSITGCPKISAMDLIKKLEPYQRGGYTGSIGFVKKNRDALFNLAIRTLEIKDQISLKVGAAITIDSDPIKEYEETLVKAAFFRKVYDLL